MELDAFVFEFQGYTVFSCLEFVVGDVMARAFQQDIEVWYIPYRIQ